MSNRIVYGDYHLLGRLNTGGMAEVFLGRDVRRPTGELLAVKRMLPRYSEDPDFVSMFHDEARISLGLHHKNICRVMDEGQHQNQLFIVMEFIHGKDMKVVHLRARDRNERVPFSLVAFVISKIADALDHAHSLRNADGELENIVHRDVSPQNILISYDGEPKLIDFGVARAKNRVAQTRVGVVKGKFAYMSPEQAMANPLDGRSDIWALGVVFYQLLTGQLPFKGASDIDTLRKIAAGESIPITEIDPNTPPELARIIGRAMQRDVGARYQRALDMANDCRKFISQDDHRIDETHLANYMQRLFASEYGREVKRIAKYRAGADAASLRQNKSQRDAGEAAKAGETTKVVDTLILAAGYQARDQQISEGEGQENVVNTDVAVVSETNATLFDDQDTTTRRALRVDENFEVPPTRVEPRLGFADARTRQVSVDAVSLTYPELTEGTAPQGLADDPTRVPELLEDAHTIDIRTLSSPTVEDNSGIFSKAQVRTLFFMAVLGIATVLASYIAAHYVTLDLPPPSFRD